MTGRGSLPLSATILDASTPRPTDSDKVAEVLAYTLRYDRRQRVHHADDIMARITAEYLIRHLERTGFVLMREPPGTAPAPAIMPSSIG